MATKKNHHPQPLLAQEDPEAMRKRRRAEDNAIAEATGQHVAQLLRDHVRADVYTKPTVMIDRDHNIAIIVLNTTIPLDVARSFQKAQQHG